jgi:hypothetical protein
MTKNIFGAIFLFIISTCANAVIIDGNFSALVYYDGSDEGVWSRDLNGVEVAGKFWYDTVMAPASDPNYPYSTMYLSQKRSWLNLTYFIDGKTIDFAKAGLNNSTPDKVLSVVNINADTDYFRVFEEVIDGDRKKDYVQTSGLLNILDTTNVIKHNRLEQSFSWVGDNSNDDKALFVMTGRSNDKQYTSVLEMYLTELTVATREVSVPAPSPFPLLLIGLAALVLRRRVDVA